MVGDWPERDVVGGRSLGMKTVFARYGDTFGTVESGADYDIDDVYELVAIVDRLNVGHPPEAGRGAGRPGHDPATATGIRGGGPGGTDPPDRRTRV
jgi:hypothetical protein